jgi:NADPH2:quinone reductase
MRAVMCRSFGRLEDLSVEEVDDPRPAPGQVVIAVEAAGVNFVDMVILAGGYQFSPPLPTVPGSEVAGRVVEVGAGVTEPAIGTRVVATTWRGGFAERVAVDAAACVALPAEVTSAVAATVLQSYSTAFFALTRRDQVRAGEVVLVLGAGGGVGLACVDVARSLGATVIGAASSPAKRAAATAAGAASVIDTSSEDLKVRARELGGGGVDVVVDPVGADLAEPALRALRFGGRYHVIGFAGGAIPRVPLNLVLLNSRTVIGVEWGGWLLRHPATGPDIAAEVIHGIAAGSLRPTRPQERPLHEAAAALADVAGRRVTGKVALIP